MIILIGESFSVKPSVCSRKSRGSLLHSPPPPAPPTIPPSVNFLKSPNAASISASITGRSSSRCFNVPSLSPRQFRQSFSYVNACPTRARKIHSCGREVGINDFVSFGCPHLNHGNEITVRRNQNSGFQRASPCELYHIGNNGGIHAFFHHAGDWTAAMRTGINGFVACRAGWSRLCLAFHQRDLHSWKTTENVGSKILQWCVFFAVGTI